MSQLSLMLRNHAVLVEPFGGSAVVNVDAAGGTVYYADTRSVSSSSNQGSIAPGGSQTFTSNAYITSAGVTTSVLVTTTSIYDEWAGVTPLNIGGVVPTGQEWINVLATPFSNVRWNTVAQASADYFGGELQSDGAQNDEVVFQKYLQAGTYTMDLFHKTGTTRGIYSIYIDGVLLGTTVDGYAATGASTRSTIAGIVVVGSIVHAVRLLMATHNASSLTPFYLGDVEGIAMTRTGA